MPGPELAGGAAFVVAVVVGIIRKLRPPPQAAHGSPGDVPRALARDLEIHRTLENWRQDLGLERLLLFCIHNGGLRVGQAGSQLYATAAGEAKRTSLRYVSHEWIKRPVFDIPHKDLLRELFAHKSCARTIAEIPEGAPLRESFAADGTSTVALVEVLDDLGRYWYAVAASKGAISPSTLGRLAGAASHLRAVLQRPL